MGSRLLALVVVVGVLVAAPSASAAGWLPAFEVRASAVAMAPDGGAVFAWIDATGAHTRVRAPGGAILAVQDLDGAGAQGVEVAVDPQGRAVFAWRNGDVIRTRVRLADGSLTAVQDLSGVAGNQEVDVAVGPGGDAAFAWRRLGPNRIFTRARSATGELSSVAQLSAAGEDSTNVAVGVDADGDATFAWQTDTGPRARLRSAAGVVSPGAPIVFDDATLSDPEIAVAADGDAVIGWRDGFTFLARGLSAAGQLEPATLTVSPATDSQNFGLGGTPDGFVRFSWGTELQTFEFTPQTRTLPPDGTLSPIVDLKPAGENGLGTFIAVGAGGDAVVAWENQLDEDQGEAVALSRAGTASPLIAIANPGIDTDATAAAVDLAGNAVFVGQPDGPGAVTRAVFWDPVPPRIDALSVPASAERGVEVPLEVSGSDAGSGVTAAWGFGDGSSGTGASVTHAFERSGSYEVELTLGDAAANQTVATRTVVVSDSIRPGITRASIKPKRFRVGKGRTRISAKRGSAFRYTLSEPARVTIAIQRRKGRRWRRAGRALSRSSHEGANRVKFSGRIGRKKLKPGRYRARLVAIDPDGNRSSRRTVKFRIVRR